MSSIRNVKYHLDENSSIFLSMIFVGFGESRSTRILDWPNLPRETRQRSENWGCRGARELTGRPNNALIIVCTLHLIRYQPSLQRCRELVQLRSPTGTTVTVPKVWYGTLLISHPFLSLGLASKNPCKDNDQKKEQVRVVDRSSSILYG